MDQNYQIIRNALDVARNIGGAGKCPQAHFGVLRHMFSLSHKTLGTNAAGDQTSLQVIPFDYSRIQKQANAPSEILLAEADGFIATHLRFSVVLRATNGTLTQGRPQMFANPDVFTTATEADRLNQIWQGGKLVLDRAGNKWNVEGLEMAAFETVESFAQGLQIVADTADVAIKATTKRGIFDGAVKLVPGFLFGGKLKIEAQVQLAEAVSFVDTATATNEYIAILETIGVYCPGVAQILDQNSLPSL